MTTAQKIFSVLIVASVLALGAILAARPSDTASTLKSFGASTIAYAYDALPHWFGGGLAVGSSQQLTVSSTGLITTSGGVVNTGTLTLGSGGTALNGLNAGTCYIKAYASTIAASTSAQVDCQANAASGASISALSGVAFGDATQVTLSTTTANVVAGGTTGGIRLAGAAASSTSGYIVLTLRNDTGGTFTWPVTGSATGTAYYIASR